MVESVGLDVMVDVTVGKCVGADEDELGVWDTSLGLR